MHASQASVSTATNSRLRRRNKWKAYMPYYMLLLPGILFFIVFKYIPISGVLIAFQDYKVSRGISGSEWVGMEWFQYLFDSPDFWMALRNTIIISFYKLFFNFPAPIVLALLLNEVMSSTFKRIIQTVVYFPHFLSWVVIAGLMYSLLSSDTGMLSIFGVSSNPLLKEDTFRSSLVLSQMWKETGWGMIIYLAAIAGINPELYEAARIDGANRLQLAIYITLPSLVMTIVILLILRTGNILHAGFDQVFILYNPMVYNVGDILDTYVYRVGIAMGRFSVATAAGLFQSFVGLLLLLTTNWIAKRLGGTGLW